MRTIDAQQQSLSTRSHLSPVTLIELTTYTDRESGTVDTRFYLSSVALRYDWKNTGTDIDFWPLIQKMGGIRTHIDHVPAPAFGLITKTLTFSISNEPWRNKRLVEILRDGHSIENATVEVAQFLLENFSQTVQGEVPILDLSSHDGDEHTTLYRGRVKEVDIQQDLIVFNCECDVPSVNWIRANDSELTAPGDLGRRLPIVYGKAKRVQSVAYEVGSQTILNDSITAALTGSVEVADATGFSTVSQSISMGVGAGSYEEASAEKIDNTHLNLTVRGINGTTPQPHRVKELCTELPVLTTFVVAGHAVDSISQLYVRNRLSQNIVEIPSPARLNTEDTTTIDGETIATVQFTQTELDELAEPLFADFVAAAGSDVRIFQYDVAERIQASYFQSGGNLGVNLSAPLFDAPLMKLRGNHPDFSPSESEGIRMKLSSGVAIPALLVTRWRWSHTYTVLNNSQFLNLPANVVLAARGIPGLSDVQEIVVQNYPHGTVIGPFTVKSDWFTPPEFTTADELENDAAGESGARLWMKHQGFPTPFSMINGTEEVIWSDISVEIEVGILPVEITGVDTVSGLDVELFADIDGYKAPTASPAYKAGAGVLMEKPADIIRHWIEVIGGGIIHAASYDALAIDHGSNVWAFDVRGFGQTWQSIAESLQFEGRLNLVPEEAASLTNWKMLAAKSNYNWPDASVASVITEWERFTEETRKLEEIITGYVFRYAYRSNLGIDDRSFDRLLVANIDESELNFVGSPDILAVQNAYGFREAPELPLFAIQDEDTAKDVAGYIVHEGIRVAALYRVIGVPWWEAFDKEVGDIITVTPPWTSVPVKCRIIEYVKNFETEQVDFRLIEIDTFQPQTVTIHLNGDDEYLRSAEALVDVADVWSITMRWRSNQGTINTQDEEILNISQASGANNRIQLEREGADPGTTVRLRIWNSSGTLFKELRYLESLIDAEFHHVVITYDGSDTGDPVVYYVDGVIQTATVVTNTTGTMTDTARRITYGADEAGASPFEGQVHTLALHDVVLSQNEVTVLYDAGVVGEIDLNSDVGNYVSSADLKHWWRVGHRNIPGIGDDYAVSVTTAHDLDAESAGILNINRIESPPFMFANTQSIHFNGIDEHMQSALAIVDIVQVFTIILWVRRTDSDTNSHFMFLLTPASGNINKVQLERQSGAGNETWWRVRIWDSAGTAIKDFTMIDVLIKNTWAQLVITFDGGAGGDPLLCYVDGIDVTDPSPLTDTTGTMTDTARHIVVGADLVPANFWEGEIVQVAILDAVLTPTEIVESYDGGAAEFDLNFGTDLVHWFQTGQAKSPLLGKDYSDSITTVHDLEIESVNIENVDRSIEIPVAFEGQIRSIDFAKASTEKMASLAEPVGIFDEWTISIWIRPTAVGTFAYVIFEIGIGPTDVESQIQMGRSTGTSESWGILIRDSIETIIKQFVSTGILVKDAWVQLVVTFDGSVGGDPLLMYANGVDVTDPSPIADDTGTLTDSPDRVLSIAAAAGGSSAICDGQILDIAIHNVAMTPAEILEAYVSDGGQFDYNRNSGNYKSASNLRQWLRLGHKASPLLGFNYANASSPLEHDVEVDALNIDDNDRTFEAPFSSQLFSISLNGANEWLASTSAAINFFDTWTVIGRFRSTSAHTVDAVIYNFEGSTANNAVKIFVDGADDSETLRVQVRNDVGTIIKDLSFTGQIVLDTWLTVAVTFDGTAGGDPLLVYMDGVLLTPTTTTVDTTGAMDEAQDRSIQIGNDAGGDLFEGDFFELATYDDVVGATGILEAYNSGAQFNYNKNFGNYTKAQFLQQWFRIGRFASPDIGNSFALQISTPHDLDDNAQNVTDVDRITDIPT